MTSHAGRSVPFGPLLAGTVVAGGLSALMTGLLFHWLKVTWRTDFAIPFRGPEAPLEPIPLVMVLVASAAPALLASGMLALLGFFLRNPLPLFALTAFLVLVFSLGAPFALPEIADATRHGLYLLHITAGGVLTGVLCLAWVLQPEARP